MSTTTDTPDKLYGVYEPGPTGSTRPRWTKHDDGGVLVGVFKERDNAIWYARELTLDRRRYGGEYPLCPAGVYKERAGALLNAAMVSYDRQAGHYLVRSDFDLSGGSKIVNQRWIPYRRPTDH